MTRLAMLLLASAALMATGISGQAQARGANWTRLADCAAYYQVNAKLSDPERPATMSAMVDETSQEYMTAAIARLQQSRKSPKESARAAVANRVHATSRRVASLPRRAVEKRIEACPQPDG